jgi:hypothetical protein
MPTSTLSATTPAFVPWGEMAKPCDLPACLIKLDFGQLGASITSVMTSDLADSSPACSLPSSPASSVSSADVVAPWVPTLETVRSVGADDAQPPGPVGSPVFRFGSFDLEPQPEPQPYLESDPRESSAAPPKAEPEPKAAATPKTQYMRGSHTAPRRTQRASFGQFAAIASLRASKDKRVDPSDGQAYDFLSFEECYGGEAPRLWYLAGEMEKRRCALAAAALKRQGRRRRQAAARQRAAAGQKVVRSTVVACPHPPQSLKAKEWYKEQGRC